MTAIKLPTKPGVNPSNCSTAGRVVGWPVSLSCSVVYVVGGCSIQLVLKLPGDETHLPVARI